MPLLQAKESSSFKEGDLLTIIAKQQSVVRLRTPDGLELDICLPDISADWLGRQLRVLASQPRLQLALETIPKPELSNDGLLDALVLRDNPRFSKNRPQIFELANAWRVQLLGTISYLAVRLAQDNGPHLPLALLQLGVSTQAAPAESVSMPLWLWGGPVLQLWFIEDEAEPSFESAESAVELLLEITLAKWGPIQLLLRYRHSRLVLNLGAESEWHFALSALEPQFKQIASQLGLQLAVYVGEPLVGLHRLQASKAARLSPAQLPLPIFKLAAEILVLLEAHA
ncbi:hypothetical protein R6242_12545 [Iodobacter sp. CM08]|uniref:hypothetical protein n=1 Tax=Iodobacter sp. CM08 TaxID=3085902 RepID=UPI002981B1F3|nr:hypothetical protein [Iodobacter sp. CM08]MDW5417395.1 hypothetical protein [Iodobacter sp. CM08]